MSGIYQYLLNYVESHFTILRTIKTNARGSVVLLRHNGSGKRFIFRHYEGGGEVYRRLLSISSENLPQILEVAEQDGCTAVLEEYIQGDSLRDLMIDGRFGLSEARNITLQLCRALWVLHSVGAVHRDVKPENIMIRGDQVVLIDFDASRMMKNEIDRDTVVLGTTGYAAPEQYGIAQTDDRADIYSVGVLLNIMLTGKHPSKELAPGKMGHIVQKSTMINPEKRYRHILDLMEAL